MTDNAEFDAHLDPWCVVPLSNGSRMLFGYAHYHNGTGGLAWLTSSNLVEMDGSTDRCTTASGRRYLLGRRFEVLDVGAEGDEARWTFEYLCATEFEDVDDLREIDRQWLKCCKAARHLNIQPPARTPAALSTFFELYAEPYAVARTEARNHRP